MSKFLAIFFGFLYYILVCSATFWPYHECYAAYEKLKEADMPVPVIPHSIAKSFGVYRIFYVILPLVDEVEVVLQLVNFHRFPFLFDSY